MVDALPILKERLQKSDASVLFNAVNDLAKVCPIYLLFHLVFTHEADRSSPNLISYNY